MISFKQFVNEVYENDSIKKSHAWRNQNLYHGGRKWAPETTSDLDRLYHPGEHISTFKGHHIYKRGNAKFTEFHAYDPETKRSTITVNGPFKHGVLSHISLSAHKTNKLKAHEFYHHLLSKGHVTALQTDIQTPGSRKVWEKLSKKRNIGIHGWHRGKPVNVKFGEDDTHEHRSADYEGANLIQNMSLVAHKKIDK